MKESEIPRALYDIAQMRALDNFAIESLGIPALTLMIRAGEFALKGFLMHWGDTSPVAIVCGQGNNAGDGYVLARLLRERGLQVAVVQVGDLSSLSEAAQTCLAQAIAVGIEPSDDLTKITHAEVVVDALFGTGLSRAISGRYADAVALINDSDAPVLSLDVPSGLQATTGQSLGPTVRAAVTTTFIAAKQGLFTGAGPDYAGNVMCDDLGVSDEAFQKIEPTAYRLTLSQLKSLMRPRARTAHKGRHGHTLIVGGAPGFLGAMHLAGEAAARVGSGLVTLAAHANTSAAINYERPELMVHSLPGNDALQALMHKTDVIAVGPGLGLSAAAVTRFSKILEAPHPLVVDADALRLLGADPQRRENWVLTPHPGEAGQLLGCTAAEVEADRFAAATAIREKFGGVVVLKGAGTIVLGGSAPEIVAHGNPGMASGGMGDVLTGVIAGLMAQGFDCHTAARLGSCVHAAAADRAAIDGERGLLARDLMQHIRHLVN